MNKTTRPCVFAALLLADVIMNGRIKAVLAFALLAMGSLAEGSGAGEASGEPVVRTPPGDMRGTTMTSRSGRTIYAFRGVRYALPPTGEQRFKPPTASKEKWIGIKDATDNGPSCPQATEFLPGPKSEDCLFLNVYSPKLPSQESNTRYPVIVWFHQGGWFDLSAQSGLAGPQYLLDEDIVLVTVNYRLGALGFLSTGDSEAPGNNGLKDQVTSLEWVRDNIAYFGGDQNSVTIYGYSAGAASVQFLMVSPLTAGLFHRAISGSGSSLAPYGITKDPKALARRQAKLLNCPHEDNTSSKDIIDCLRKKDANDLAKSYSRLQEWSTDPTPIYTPVIEAEGSTNRPFLTADPTSLFLSGNFTHVPWITGTVENEAMIRGVEILANQSLLDDLNQHFERIMPIALFYERNTPTSRRMSQRIKEFYLGNGDITQDSLQALSDMFTDSIFVHPADRSVKIISRVSSAPVYYYQFTYKGRFGYMEKEPGMDRPRAVVHVDDLIYIFYGEGLFPFFGSDYPEMLTSQRLVKMWANFARTGDPTPDHEPKRDALLPTVWSPHTPSGLAYMEIGAELKMKRSLRQDKMAFWDQIFPINNSH